MRTFSINGKLYRAVPVTFNTIADLEDMGVSLTDMQKRPMATVRAYFALCAGGDADYAGNEIQAHIIAGGKLDSLFEALAAEMEDSDFFRSLATFESESSGESEETQPKKKTAKK